MIELANYNCIGFDLDNTLLEYNVGNMSVLIYEAIADFLINQKQYPTIHLKKSFVHGLAFLQKGLAMDLKRGNIVKMSETGVVLRASHGTRMLNSREISEIYGPSKIWNMAEEYCRNPLQALKGNISEEIRCVLDNFDIPALLVYGRAVDTIDELDNDTADYPKVWANILEALQYIYQRESFGNNQGAFFPALTAHPAEYIKKCPDEVLDWLRELKTNGKYLFLITGSNSDYANFTSNYALGSSWKDFFDVIVYYARKPAFFAEQRPYLSVVQAKEGDECKLNANMKEVSQGNWMELSEAVIKKKHGSSSQILYVGDNMLQDVLAPVQFGCCKTLAICGEYTPQSDDVSVWGSYYHDADGEITFWNSLLQNNATYYVESVSALVKILKSDGADT